ncbi:unnamed protein product [Fructobacillus fructosus]|uniref:Uncharacterized protein n=1 Tax=Fructobacillus fructosus TaxID=1631 RepID=A0ABN9YTV2_9LACO|nr:unnamed protein product [Fructobacillus fructosus]
MAINTRNLVIDLDNPKQVERFKEIFNPSPKDVEKSAEKISEHFKQSDVSVSRFAERLNNGETSF